MEMSTPPSPWLVLQDGRAGTDGQAQGLVVTLKVPYQLRSLNLHPLQYCMPPLMVSNSIIEKLFESETHPPAGIIGAGRRAAYGLLAASRHWPGITTIQIQDPRIDPSHFTHVITPAHDELKGDNVIHTLGSLHRVNDALLQDAGQLWNAKLSSFQRPRVAVLIGGNNKYIRMNPDWVDNLIAKCYELLKRDMSLWITVSRRTPELLRERLRAAFPHKENVWFWSGAGDNPYLGFLAHADYFLVTADSVSMISEALFTSKPVALLRMPGNGKKFNRFYDQLFARGLTHWFDGDWSISDRPQLNETARVAALLKLEMRG